MPDREKVMLQCKQAIDSGQSVTDYNFYYDVLSLLKEKETVEHALDVLRKNGWKEKETCEKCTLLMVVSDGVHDMAKQFRMGGEVG